jgi:flagellar hook-length control protein FliK
MITAALAITSTAPGQPARGSVPAGGDLFALSMLAVGADAGPALAEAALPTPAGPVRQALAAPGMAVPTPDAAAVDPALAWLPAVNIAIPAPLDIPPALASVVPAVAIAPVVASRTLRGGASVSVLAATLPASVGASVTDVADTGVPFGQPMQRPAAVRVGFADAPVADGPPGPADALVAPLEVAVSTPSPVIDERTMPAKAAPIRAANTGDGRETDIAADAMPILVTGSSGDDEATDAAVEPAPDATMALQPDPVPPAIMAVAAQPVEAPVVPPSDMPSPTSPAPGRVDVATAGAGGTPLARYAGAPVAAVPVDMPATPQRGANVTASGSGIVAPAPAVPVASPPDDAADVSQPTMARGQGPTLAQPTAATPRIDAPAPRPAGAVSAGEPAATVVLSAPKADTARTSAAVGSQIDMSAARPVGVQQPAAVASHPDTPVAQPVAPLPANAADPIAGQRVATPASPKRGATVAPATDIAVAPVGAADVPRANPVDARFPSLVEAVDTPAASQPRIDGTGTPAAAPVAPAMVDDGIVATETRIAPDAQAVSPRTVDALLRAATTSTMRGEGSVVDADVPGARPATGALASPNTAGASPAQPVAAPFTTATAPANAGARTRGLAARGDMAPARRAVVDATAPAAATTVAAGTSTPPIIAAAAPVAATGVTMATAPADTPAAVINAPAPAATTVMPTAPVPATETAMAPTPAETPATVQAQPSFVREVSGATRQTVALRPQTAAMPQPAAGTTAPAAQVFGAAMHAATSGDERQRTEPVDPAITAVAAPVPVGGTAPVGDAAQPTLDMRQNNWPTSMIDHIEALRDAANASDTRIRLVPDALGAIDIAVKTVGNAIHIRFAADDATTRTMIEDARPGLIAIAEERGLRIGQAIVEAAPSAQTANQNNGQSNPNPSSANQPNQQSATPSPNGNGQQGAAQAQAQAGQQQPRQQQQTATARQPAAPASARTPSNDTDAAATGRIA